MAITATYTGFRVCIASMALIMTACSESLPVDEEQRAFDAVDVKPLPPPDEYAEQRKAIEDVNRCLGILEAAASITDENIVAEMKERGVLQITSKEIMPLLSIASAIERDSSLPEYEIKEIVEKSRAPLGSEQQIRERLNEIVECVQLSRLEASEPSQ